jgi:hypothetical protein
MASVSIRTRKTKSGKRFQVRYRLGGRGYPLVHGGVFATMKEARVRRDFIAGELAAGRNPSLALQAVGETPIRRTFAQWAKSYKRSRVDVSAATLANTETHIKRLLPIFGERDPHSLSFAEIQEWVSSAGAMSTSPRTASVCRPRAPRRAEPAGCRCRSV